jgi:hypothetical protein
MTAWPWEQGGQLSTSCHCLLRLPAPRKSVSQPKLLQPCYHSSPCPSIIFLTNPTSVSWPRHGSQVRLLSRGLPLQCLPVCRSSQLFMLRASSPFLSRTADSVRLPSASAHSWIQALVLASFLTPPWTLGHTSRGRPSWSLHVDRFPH